LAEAAWISAETEQKERHFRGLLRTHIGACKAILGRRRGSLPYLFVDLHGGPGNLEYKGRTFPGSPLIAREELAEACLTCETLHFECAARDAELLGQALRGWPEARIYQSRFEQGIVPWLDGNGYQRFRYGLVYSDPIKDPIPVETFNLIAERLPRVDLLAYVSATNQYKRANANGAGHGRRLADDVQAINKRRVLLREPRRAEHYTFILWSNWDGLFDWKRAGFHRLDSGRGQEILAVADNTKQELHAKRNTPLPFPLTEPTPSTFGTPGSWPSEPRCSSEQAASASGAGSGQRPSRTISATHRGAPSTSPRTWSPSAIHAIAEPTGRSGDGES
jgi:hypothetical protein